MALGFRRVIFWIHLIAGVVAGVVVLVMSATGVLLTYQRQMVAWADNRLVHVAPHAANAPRASVDSLLAGARPSRSGTPSAVTLRADGDVPATVSFGREGVVLVDPYTAAALGTGSTGMRSFFRVVEDWHRTLGRSGESRATGRMITGACNFAFLILVLTGPYLWLPRRWNRRQVRQIAWFRGGLSAKARDFNWHNVVGVWSAIPLVVIVASGVVMSYPWANALVYKVVGEQPPARQGPEAPAGARAAGAPGAPGGRGQRGNRAGGGEGGRGGDRVGGRGGEGRVGAPRVGAPRVADVADAPAPPLADAPAPASFDVAVARASQQVPEWKTLQLTIPAAEARRLTVSIDAGTGGQPQKRGTLTLDRTTGAVQRWEPFSSQSPGRRLRSFLRFAHTGEFYGLLGQTIAGLVSLGAVVLVWTGLALALRRFVLWIARRRQPASEATETRAAA